MTLPPPPPPAPGELAALSPDEIAAEAAAREAAPPYDPVLDEPTDDSPEPPVPAFDAADAGPLGAILVALLAEGANDITFGARVEASVRAYRIVHDDSGPGGLKIAWNHAGYGATLTEAAEACLTAVRERES